MNQPEPRGDRDLWADDVALREALERTAACRSALARFGAAAGRAEMAALGRAANRHPPELIAFDRAGRRLDEVAYHPAYHALMGFGMAEGYHSVAWTGGSHADHAAMVYMLSQVEPGVCCPLTMTYAAVPLLDGLWREKALARDYDPAPRPPAAKASVTLGMALTEKQGGSDLRATATSAEPDGDGWRLTGHKWFCSAPMSDAFLTLARTPKGLTCFLVPRWLEGRRNGIRLMRLKDKLGNRANASAEIEYERAWAVIVGEEGRGVPAIIPMIHHTRLDTALAPAGLMRAALDEALWWCARRTAFGRRLIDQPLMAAVLADLALEAEAAVALGFRVARAFDEGDRGLARIGVALAKFRSNRLCPGVVYEAMECLGGAGYVEESPLPLYFREAPLNSIWEGSGNVICLDVLRTLSRDQTARERLWSVLEQAELPPPAFRRALGEVRRRWPDLPGEGEARWYAERLATLLAVAALLEGDRAVAEAFVARRLGPDGGPFWGALPPGIDPRPILARRCPEAA